jgi:hypothetical protein
MIYKSVIKLLNDRLKLIPNLPTVVEENKNYKPTLRTKYISTILLPAPSNRASISSVGQHRYAGIFQINLHLPSDVGSDDELVDNIVSQFRNVILQDSNYKINIINSYRGPALIDRDWYVIPISVSWECFTDGVII